MAEDLNAITDSTATESQTEIKKKSTAVSFSQAEKLMCIPSGNQLQSSELAKVCQPQDIIPDTSHKQETVPVVIA